MIKINQYIGIVCYGLILLIFSMCNVGELDFNDIKTPNLRSDNSIVIGRTTYTLKELIGKLEDSEMEISEDNAKLLSITYRDTTTFDDYLSVIELDDVSNTGVIDAGLVPVSGSPSDQDLAIPTQNLSFEYSSPENEEIDSVKYSAGTITLDIRNGYASSFEYELILTDVVNLTNGNPMVFSGTLPASGSDNTIQNLANHKALINYDEGMDANLFSGQFDGLLKVKTGDFINGTEVFNYSLNITGVGVSEIYGWFGSKTIDIPDKTTKVGFFEGISKNSLVFSNPQVNFYIDNSFGMRMGLNLDGISVSNADGTNLRLSGNATETPQPARAPGTGAVGTSERSIIKVDEKNSNLRDLLAISPNVFNIDINAKTNHNNDSDGDRNFVASNSAVKVITEINLPLNIKLQNFSRDFGTGIEAFDFEEADTIRLIVTTENQLPVDGTIDMQFLAADSSVLFEFSDMSFMTSPEVPASGKTEEPVTTKDTVKVYRGNGYQELLDASILNIVTNITSYKADEDNYVKIFSDYELILKVGVQVKTNHEL